MSAVSILISWNRPSTGGRLGLSGSPARRAGLHQHAGAVGPSGAVLRDEVGEEPAVLDAGVERRHVHELTAARGEETCAIFHVDLLDGLEAVDGETRAHDRHF